MKEERLNVTIYGMNGSILKVYYNIDDINIGSDGWIYIRKDDADFVYNRDVIGKMEVDRK